MGAGGSVAKAEEAGLSGEKQQNSSLIGETETSNVAEDVISHAVEDPAAVAGEDTMPEGDNENEADRAARVEAFRLEQKNLKKQRDASTEKLNQNDWLK